FGFAGKAIAATDVLHMAADYPGNGAYHARFTLGTTWTNTNAEAQTHASAHATSAAVTALSTTNMPVDGCTDGGGDANTMLGSNADAGTSWTAGFASQVDVYSGESNSVQSGAILPLASGDMLWIGSNGGATYSDLFSNVD